MMEAREKRKQFCLCLNAEARQQLEEGAAREHLPKNFYIEKLLREDFKRYQKELKKEKGN